ncbi:MAG: hypothetical protein ABW185_10960, partial [Sedimenticola sp.]
MVQKISSIASVKVVSMSSGASANPNSSRITAPRTGSTTYCRQRKGFAGTMLCESQAEVSLQPDLPVDKLKSRPITVNGWCLSLLC